MILSKTDICVLVLTFQSLSSTMKHRTSWQHPCTSVLHTSTTTTISTHHTTNSPSSNVDFRFQKTLETFLTFSDVVSVTEQTLAKSNKIMKTIIER